MCIRDRSWEDNETVRELMACAAEGSITVNTSLYGGFEQVGSLPRQFSRNDVQTVSYTHLDVYKRQQCGSGTDQLRKEGIQQWKNHDPARCGRQLRRPFR